jgi:microcystin-dependent protein
MHASGDPADNNVVTNAMAAKPLGRGNNLYTTASGALVTMNFSAIAPTGGDQPHNNMQPYLTLSFCIALQGVFPPRT